MTKTNECCGNGCFIPSANASTRTLQFLLPFTIYARRITQIPRDKSPNPVRGVGVGPGRSKALCQANRMLGNRLGGWATKADLFVVDRILTEENQLIPGSPALSVAVGCWTRLIQDRTRRNARHGLELRLPVEGEGTGLSTTRLSMG